MTDAQAVEARISASIVRADGILNINKPPGITSHDVVMRVRRLTGQRRVGHSGTLDPMATGVLLVCVGQATRVAEYLMQGQKRYRATVRLGIATDTYDADGAVTEETSAATVQEGQIVDALASLRNTTHQLPPPYSAVHVDGNRLYQLARQGIRVQPARRHIKIAAIDLLEWQSPDVTIEIDCSPGTYVRSLAHDLGHMLGVGGHLTALVRLRSGNWRVDDATTLDTLRAAVETGEWTGLLHPLDAALQDFPRFDLSQEMVSRLTMGQQIPIEAGPDSDVARVYAPDGSLRAIVQPSSRDPGWWQPKKVFNA